MSDLAKATGLSAGGLSAGGGSSAINQIVRHFLRRPGSDRAIPREGLAPGYAR
jgi:hypothetical protein